MERKKPATVGFALIPGTQIIRYTSQLALLTVVIQGALLFFYCWAGVPPLVFTSFVWIAVIVVLAYTTVFYSPARQVLELLIKTRFFRK